MEYIDADDEEVLNEQGSSIGSNEVKHGFKDRGEEKECSDEDRELSHTFFFDEGHILLDHAEAGQEDSN